MWGFAKKGRLVLLVTKQKKSIRKIHNLKYRDHTNNYFLKSRILKLPDLIKHTAVCCMQSGLFEYSPAHIKALWTIRKQEREDLRSRDIQLDYTVTPKQWINDLPPIAQAKLWNNDIFNKTIDPSEFKYDSKEILFGRIWKRHRKRRRQDGNTSTLSHPLINSPGWIGRWTR